MQRLIDFFFEPTIKFNTDELKILVDLIHGFEHWSTKGEYPEKMIVQRLEYDVRHGNSYFITQWQKCLGAQFARLLNKCSPSAIFACLRTSIIMNNLKSLKLLRENLGDNFNAYLTKKDDEGNKLLQLAGAMGMISIADYLIESKANTQSINSRGKNYSDCVNSFLNDVLQYKNIQVFNKTFKSYLGKLTLETHTFESILKIQNSNPTPVFELLDQLKEGLGEKFAIILEQCPPEMIFKNLRFHVEINDVKGLEKWKNFLNNDFPKYLKMTDEKSDTLLHCAGFRGHYESAQYLIKEKSNPYSIGQENLDYYGNLYCYVGKFIREDDYEQLKKIFKIFAFDLSVITNENQALKKYILAELNNMDLRVNTYEFLTQWEALLGSCFTNFIKQCHPGRIFYNLRLCVEKNELYNLKKWQNWLCDDFSSHLKEDDLQGNTLLHFAGNNGNIEIIDYLLLHKADPTATNRDHFTYVDSFKNCIKTLALKNELGKIINIFSYKNSLNHPEFCRLVFPLLTQTVKSGNLDEFAQWEAALGERYNQFLTAKYSGNSLLHLAALNGNIEIAEILLEKKADIFAENDNGFNYFDCLNAGMLKNIKQKNFKQIKKILAIKTIRWNFINENQENTGDIFADLLHKCIRTHHYEEYKNWLMCFPNETKRFMQKQGDINKLEAEMLNSHIIKLVLEKNYKQLADILLDNETIDLTIQNADGVSALNTLIHAFKNSININDTETFVKLQSAMHPTYFKKIINTYNDEGNTVFTQAILFERHDLKHLLVKAGADLNDDFVTRFKQLPPNAFAKAPLIQNTSEAKLYDTYVSEYSKGANNEVFIQQFRHLIDLFEIWGMNNASLTSKVQEGLTAIRTNFFDVSYSGSQPNAYFSSIKENLEKIYGLLNNQNFTLKKRQSHYQHLCTQFVMCCPGLNGHIASTLMDLQTSVSCKYWLSEKRSSTIHFIADLYNTKKNINSGYSIHTHLAMLRDATEKGWNPLLNINEMKDIFAVDVGFSNDAKGHKNRESFHLIFMKEYSFETIRECYKVNLEIEIIKICKDLGYDFNKTNNVIDNKIFQALLTRLEALCEQLEVKIAVEKYISMNKNYTQFKINSNPILNKLCQKIIPAHLYFNKRNKKYCNLIPNEWLKNEECENNHFDWSIWKEIPKKTLPNLFKKISLKLSLENIYLLYHHLVTLKVFKDEAFLQEIAAHKLNFIKPLTNMPTKLLKNGLFLVEGKTNETQKSISSSYTSRSS